MKLTEREIEAVGTAFVNQWALNADKGLAGIAAILNGLNIYWRLNTGRDIDYESVTIENRTFKLKEGQDGHSIRKSHQSRKGGAGRNHTTV